MIMSPELHTQILSLIPQKPPFRFVDAITSVDDTHIEGHYTLKEDEYFYQGHFPESPVTPGVILTEIAAQIALVAYGIFLLLDDEGAAEGEFVPLFSSSQIDFFKPVMPGEQVFVKGTKTYFRFRKLKCQVEMTNQKDEIVLKGSVSGMMVNQEKDVKR